MALLKDLSLGVYNSIRYQSRDDEGTQIADSKRSIGAGDRAGISPCCSWKRRAGLGFGARIVSGYLFNSTQRAGGSTDAGTTHAWGEVFVSGAGWITFDPTNRSVGGSNLIPVAVARDIAQTMPVAGSFFGNDAAFTEMKVEVAVTAM